MLTKDHLQRVLQSARRFGASDVHLKVGRPPFYRIDGSLREVKDFPEINDDAMNDFARAVMTPGQWAHLESDHEVDFSVNQNGCAYRANVFQQRGHTGMVFRVISDEVPPFDSLGLPASILKIAKESRGLSLVTGSTGSGKSTTLAAIIQHINKNKAEHIVTVEDPIEYRFRDVRSVINQREVGQDTNSFSKALRSALRQDPDVILVGEMRDMETIKIALQAAETGHLVLSTLHASDVASTMTRIVSVFPAHQQAAIRLQLATVLNGIVSLRLLRHADGKSRVPAAEVMLNTARMRDLIANKDRNVEIFDAIEDGVDHYGMQSFDQSLMGLLKDGKITKEVAIAAASNPEDFALKLSGISDTSSWG